MSEENNPRFGQWMASQNHTRTGTEYDWFDMSEAFASGFETARQEAAEREPEAPEPAKVIVVTEQGGRERRFDADSWDVGSEFGTVSVERSSREDDPVVALYNHGAWLSVREDGAEAPDSTVRALGIAKRALEAVTRISDPNVAIQLAQDALGEIFAETE
jgi:hypothetical protein